MPGWSDFYFYFGSNSLVFYILGVFFTFMLQILPKENIMRGFTLLIQMSFTPKKNNSKII